MPPELERCVKSLKAKGSKGNAWAICTASLQKSGKMNERRRAKHAELQEHRQRCRCSCDSCGLNIAPTFKSFSDSYAESDIEKALAAHAKERRGDMPMDELLSAVGGSASKLKSNLLSLRKAGKIKLSIWSGSLDRLPNRSIAIPEKDVTGTESNTYYWFVRLPSQYAEKFGEGAHALNGVEIFATGTHRGKSYTDDDLDQMVSNFRRYSVGKRTLLKVPAVLGHEEDQSLLERSDLPAAAWATDLWRARKACPACEGAGLTEDAEHKCQMCDGRGEVGVLKASFRDVPPKVARLLKGKAYATVSAEIYDEPPEGVPGEGKMLRRVAFSGRRAAAGQEPRRYPGASRALGALASGAVCIAVQVGVAA